MVQDYLVGLKKQINADVSNEIAFWKDWEEGFRARAGAVAEMIDFVSPDLIHDNMLPANFCKAMREYTGFKAAEKSEEVYLVQAILANNSYIYPEDIDGISGNNTYQELRDYLSSKNGIYCWIISEKLIKNLIDENILDESSFMNAVEMLKSTGQIGISNYEKLDYAFYHETDE